MINKATLLGRIGKKDSKTLKNGGEVTQISVATNRKFIDSQGAKQEITTWHNVNCFNKLAEIANKYAHVGDLIYIEGEISNKKIDQGNGEFKFIYSITANDIRLIPNGKKDGQTRDGNTKSRDPFPHEMDDEIPF